MDRIKLKILAERLGKEIKKAEVNAKESKKSANEISAGLVGSYSIAGDVEHARNSALLSLQKLDLLKALALEVSVSLREEIPSKIIPASFITLTFDDGRTSEFYFVKTPVNILGIRFISPNSIFGKSIVNKSIGDSFSYTVEDQKFSGKISSIN
jgi:transcription elongation GreA/GreB family factor